MKNIKTIMVTLAVLLGLALTLPSSTALETNILIVKEVNLTVDIDPAFEASNMSISEDNIQFIVVENLEEPSAGNATIMVATLITPEKPDPRVVSKFMENFMIGFFELTGDKEVGNFSVNDSYGREVKVHTFSEKKPSTPSGRYDFASWYLDEWNYIFLASSLNDTTKSIIETLSTVA
ncbi:MAG TPA: hypothetical protein HA349_02240 [Methanotrichaceae archaeon]|nr:hypothetical protein [Methanotrichaceae archaeon]